MHGDFSPDLEQDKAGLVNMRRAVNFSELNQQISHAKQTSLNDDDSLVFRY